MATSHKKTTSKSSSSNFLCKSLIAILVLVIIPLFPSQAPDFIKQSIFPQLWELLHLMFIGIAVCYGLFSKRTHIIDFQTRPSYLSGISNVSSIFDNNGHENENLYEKIAMPEIRVFHNLQNECVGKENSDVIRNRVIDHNERTWNSQYSIGNWNQGISPNSHFDHNKPLGLPVRSLKSRVAEIDELESGVEKSPILSSSGGSFRATDSNVEDIRGMVHMKLEKELRSRRRASGGEVSKLKPAPQYSRSQSASEFEFGQFRSPSSQSSSKNSSPGSSTSTSTSMPLEMDLEELPVSVSHVISVHGDTAESSLEIEDELDDVGKAPSLCSEEVSYGKPPSHSEIHSFGESDDDEHVKSWSFWHPMPSSETNSKSSSPTKDTASPELPNIEMHDHRERKDVKAPSVLVSHPIVTSVHGEAKLIASRNQWPSSDVRDDCSRVDSVDSCAKPPLRPKVLLRGKSVRTIRPRRITADDLKSNHGASVKSRTPYNPLEALSRKGDPIPSSAFSHGRKEDSDTGGDNLETGEDSIRVLNNNSDTSSDEEQSGSYLVDDVELGSEVDRKADEFIAKFREQIRLQKVESFRRYST